MTPIHSQTEKGGRSRAAAPGGEAADRRDDHAAPVERLVAVIQELSLARSIAAVQEIVRHAARALTGADGATFILRDGDQCFYADEDAIEPLWKGRRFPMSACISGWVMIHRRPAVIEDIYVDDRIPVDAYRPTFVKSLAMVPIRASDPVGAIGNYWKARRKPTERELELLQALADSASIALENVALYEALENRVRERTAALGAAQQAAAEARRLLEERRRAEEALQRTEEQLRQAQKMEAVGRLAAGIAHDFNNVLSVVLGYGAMLLEDLSAGDPLRGSVEEILAAGERAKSLTGQMLAFSRQQVLEPRLLDLDQVVGGMETMLGRLIGADVQLEIRAAAPLPSVLADPGQLEQVLMNLAVNARDAMPGGGRLTVETATVHLDEDYAHAHVDVTPGDYVMLAVSDTGTGMDRETQARIFEPFYTTKEAGKGTGLGLSTVYGIVKQSGGHVWVYSEPGTGTTMKVYLPVQAGSPSVRSKPLPDVTRLTGTESILLVEDDDQVRGTAKGILRRGGYHVLEARNGGEALLICEQHGGTIHLLLTDVVMPRISGVQLARRLQSTRPDMRAICMSGYTDGAVLDHGVVDSGLWFLQKPLTRDALLLKVRQVLDRD